jgi:two-component system CheB/CheR fusion protein
MFLAKAYDLGTYLSYLRTHPAELTALYEDLLINVTEFFRDPEVFEALKESVFPRLLQDRRRENPIRIWVPGCSTGEEPYSLAMSLLEVLDHKGEDIPVQIFGTDISDAALQKARAGVYPQASVRSISEERLRRFFTRKESSFAVSKQLRDMCIFARQNVTKDPPFSNLDLISCRNVLIYLGQAFQKKVFPLFHYALRPTGYLLLGSAEGIGHSAEMFRVVDKRHKIFARRPTASRVPVELAIADRSSHTTRPERGTEPWTDRELQHEADRLVASRLSHAGVIIDGDMNIVQFRGDVTPYLRSAPGIATLNLLKMSREGLLVELRDAVDKARKEQRRVRRDKLRIQAGANHIKFVAFEVVPFGRLAGREDRYLILFEETRPPEEEPRRKTAAPRRKRPDPAALERDNEQLRHELQATQEYLQSILEEHEASDEELRSANEEILSANEELQSTNEELETAKEELQSTNEELSTLNEELHSRNSQLNQTMNDLLNVLGNVNIPIVMVGNDLRIRRFTPASEKLLNLIPTDVGRPITDIHFNIEIPGLRDLLHEVKHDLAPKTIELRDWNGRPYSLRLRPYRTEDNKIDGVVMVLVDVDPTHAQHIASTAEPIFDRENRFAQELMLAQDDERRRLARELHDEFSQRLALLEVTAEMLERRGEVVPEVQDQLGLFRRQIGELSTDLRTMAYRLHPTVLEDLGLKVALNSFLQEMSARDGLKIRAAIIDVPRDLQPVIGTAAYRIVQEAVRNVLRHAPGATVDVSVRAKADKLSIRIKDNGPGFDTRDPLKKGLGLTAIEERARGAGGSAKIGSAPGEGTEVSVELPLALA